jgi:hypothetical protein
VFVRIDAVMLGEQHFFGLRRSVAAGTEEKTREAKNKARDSFLNERCTAYY